MNASRLPWLDLVLKPFIWCDSCCEFTKQLWTVEGGKKSGKTYSANMSVLKWLQVGLSSSSSLNPHHSHPESHYTSDPSDNPIRLNFILQLYAPCSWCFTNYYISKPLAISVRYYSAWICKHSHICKSFISVVALLCLSFFHSTLRTKQKQVYLHTLISIKTPHTHCSKTSVPTSTLFRAKTHSDPLCHTALTCHDMLVMLLRLATK